MLSNTRAKHGFTLIELLVVVAIIALLISILLPSLAQAREQAKVAVCLSNGRSLMQSCVLYLNDHQEGFPLGPKSDGVTGTCSWMYGGKTSHKDWYTLAPYAYHIINDRPLNKYILGSEPVPDVYDGGGYSPENIVSYTEVPQLRCPSDTMSYQRVLNADVQGDPKGISAYNDIGTSYHFNMNFLWRGTGGPGTQVDVRKQGMPSANFTTWFWHLGGMEMITASAIRTMLNKGASTFIMFWEDPLDYAFNVDTPGQATMGQHKRFSVHTVLFLDGHVKNQKIDPRRYCGSGWTAQVQAWVPQVPTGGGAPQYPPTEYYYTNYLQRTCDPFPN